MDNIKLTINKTKKLYRLYFLEFASELNQKIYDMKPGSIAGEIFDSFESDSLGKKWQLDCLSLIKDSIAPNVYKEIYKLKQARKNAKYKCKQCGSCCRLAVSEFSYEELKEKSSNGDNFATQFLSTFIPYNSLEDARLIYPQYIDFLINNSDERVYFYHCPKVSSDNLCPSYSERPQICKDFPDNQFNLLHPNCSFNNWKNDVLENSLKYFAQAEIIEYYLAKLNIALQ